MGFGFVVYFFKLRLWIGPNAHRRELFTFRPKSCHGSDFLPQLLCDEGDQRMGES